MFKRFLIIVGLLFSCSAFSANSDTVNACADYQQLQTNGKITRKQSVTFCQCTEQRNEQDFKKIQGMKNPTQAQVRKVVEDSARYCLNKAGIYEKGSSTTESKTKKSKNIDNDDDEPISSAPQSGSSVNGITIQGIR